MKTANFILAAALAVSSVNAAAAPEADASPEWFIRYCHVYGQPCNKLKRAAEALAEAAASASASAEANPEWFLRYCHVAGQPCNKAKRAVEEINQAFYDSTPYYKVEYDESSPEYKTAVETCDRPHGACVQAYLTYHELKKPDAS